ncbi:MAG TPA: MEDS domain-containing protein [Candidatus Elarobacter sp.]
MTAASPSAATGRPDLQHHTVQFFGDAEPALARNVGVYLAGGLEAGESAIVIALRENRSAIRAVLHERGLDVGALVADGRLEMLDAAETLAALTFDGLPDRDRFADIVESRVRRAPRVRAYGEMVGLLWGRGERAAAVALEGLWNELHATTPGLALFCGYPIDVFGDAFGPGHLDELLCAHTHVVSSYDDGALCRAIERAMDEILAGSSAEMRRLMKPNHRPAWGSIPRGETLVLWLRNNLPDAAGPILARAKTYCCAAA